MTERKRAADRSAALFSLGRFRFLRRGQTVHDRCQISVRRRSENLERLRNVCDVSIRADHEQRPVVQFALGIVRRVQLADSSTRIAGEEHGEILVVRPRRERGVRIYADAEDDDVPAIVEERGVLITVRLHLNRSAFGSRLIKEREDDGPPTVV